ncbi:ankyrin repeat-containing domain protein [Baffinella frigidus]|nr:ankyrin repeat-containing domain protein [Cryptophyta sp. CCMP2293]
MQGTQLHFAAWSSDEVEVRKLLDAGADVHAKTYSDNDMYLYGNGQTPLHAGMRGGCSHLVTRMLLDAGADFSAKDDRGTTPLQLAWEPGSVRMLLEAGAEVNLKNEYGRTALHDAGSVATVRILLNGGADATLKDDEGATPLHLVGSRFQQGAPGGVAGEDSIRTIARMLLDAGADADAKCDDGRTPMHCAARRGGAGLALVRFLMAAGADISSSTQGVTPLYDAARSGSEAMVRMLLDAGADGVVKSSEEMTPLDVALDLSHHEVAALLRAVARRRATCIAFAMGLQERLGAESPVGALEPEVVRMVLEQV